MSATIEPSGGKYVDFAEYVEYQLGKARQQIRTTDVLYASTIALAAIVAYILVFVIFDQWIVTGGLPAIVRWVGLAALIGGLGAWFSRRILVPLMRQVGSLFAAKEVEASEPGLRSNLLNWVDLQAAGRPVDPAVLLAIERQAAVQLQKINVADAIDHRPLVKSGYALLAIVVLFCIYLVSSPKRIGPSLWRVFPLVDAAPATRTEILSVTPGDTQVLAGQPLEVRVELGGKIPQQVRLRFSTADKKYRDEPVLMQPDGEAGTRFRGVLTGESGKGLLQELEYRIEAGDALSSRYHVTIDQPPSAKITQVVLTPPAYTKLPAETVTSGNFSGLEGSRVELSATVNMPVKLAKIQFLEEANGQPTGEEIPVSVAQGTNLTAMWNLAFREDGTYPQFYRMHVTTEAGRTDPAPSVHQLTIRRDQPPEVVLLSPERDLEAPTNGIIPLLVQARDPDFELGPITLVVDRDGKVLLREVLSEGKRPAVELQHEWKLEPLKLEPGAEVTFWIDAQDNRQPRRNRKQTPPLRLKIIAPADPQAVQEQLEEEKARQQQQLAEAAAQRNAEQPAPMMDDERPEPMREPRPDQPKPEEPMPADGANPPNEPMPNDGGDQKQPGKPGENGREGAEGPKGTQNKPGKPGETPSETGKPEQDSPPGEQRKPLSAEGEDDDRALKRLVDKLRERNQKKPGDQPEQQSPENPQPNQPGEQQEPGGKEPGGKEPGGKEPGGKEPGGKEPGGKEPGGKEPGGKEPGGKEPGGNEPGGKEPGGKEPGGKEPGGKEPGGKEPGGKEPGGKEPGGKEPGGKEPGGKEPGGNEPGGNEPGGKEPGGKEPGGKEPGGKEPGGKEPGGKEPGGKEPIGKEPGGKEPGGKEPGGKEPGGKRPGGKEPGGKEPGGKEPGGKEPGGKEPGGKEPGGKGTRWQRTRWQRTRWQRTRWQRTRWQRTRREEPGGKEPGGKEPGGKEPGGKEPRWQRTRWQRTRWQRTRWQRTRRERTRRQGTRWQRTCGKEPGGKEPGGKEPGGKEPGGKEPGGKEPGGKEPGGKEPGGKEPGGKEPGGKEPGGKEPGGKEPGGKEPGGKEPGGKEPGGKEPGGKEPGGKEPGGKEPGGKEPGGKEPGGNEPGGQEPGGNEPGGNQPGGQKPGQPQPGSGNPKGEPMAGGQPGGQNNAKGGNDPTSAVGDEANLEYNRQAAELVLQQLQKDLERGEVSPELLDELGWTPEQLQRFTDRLAQELNRSNETTPESDARRLQFEEMLRNLNLRSTGTKRTGEQGTNREVDQIDSRRSTVPAEYRKAWERYTERFGKAKPAVKP